MIKFITLLVASCIIIPSVQSAEWSVTGRLNPSIEYDDNVFMAENETSSYRRLVSPTAIFSREQDNNNASLSLGYVIDRYASISDLDRQDPFVRFNSGFQTERSNLGLAASYMEGSSRDTAEVDTGDFTTNSTVTTKKIAPSYSYQLTERDNLSISGSYTERAFSTTDFNDTELLSLNTGWTHQFSERFNGGLNLTVSNFESTGSTFTSDDDNYNLSSSIRYDYSELWNIGGNVGIRKLNSKQTDNLGVTDSNSSSGLSLDINASRTTELDTMSFGISRAVLPSNTGDVNETDRISFSWSRKITETISTSFNSSYQQTTSAIEENNQERENLNISPAINWQFERNLGLNLAYKYRQQKESELSTNVSSNSLSLTLNYDWDGLRASR